jgi:hypothetical protein
MNRFSKFQNNLFRLSNYVTFQFHNIKFEHSVIKKPVKCFIYYFFKLKILWKALSRIRVIHLYFLFFRFSVCYLYLSISLYKRLHNTQYGCYITFMNCDVSLHFVQHI